MKNCILLMVLSLGATPLFAKSITNNELLKACKDKGLAPQNFCYGFIIATANAAEFYRNLTDVQGEYLDICFPKDISNQEVVKGYIEWIEKNTSLVDSPAFIGVSSSFSIKYSCPKKKKQG
jgi:hypothetical protein